MAEEPTRTTAKIYQFPVRSALPLRHAGTSAAPYIAGVGGAWYHEAAMQEVAEQEAARAHRPPPANASPPWLA